MDNTFLPKSVLLHFFRWLSVEKMRAPRRMPSQTKQTNKLWEKIPQAIRASRREELYLKALSAYSMPPTLSPTFGMSLYTRTPL